MYFLFNYRRPNYLKQFVCHLFNLVFRYLLTIGFLVTFLWENSILYSISVREELDWLMLWEHRDELIGENEWLYAIKREINKQIVSWK